MFGIDLGITVSSVTLITKDGKILDYRILFGDKKDPDEWHRVTVMADFITDTITEICRGLAGTYISPLVAIEEPVYPYRTQNPRSFFNMSCLYSLVRNKLSKRSFKIYSINPVTVKAAARAVFKGKKLGQKYMVRGRLTKKGMLRAFKKVHKRLPDYSNNIGRETLADSFFIAVSGIDKRRLGIK